MLALGISMAMDLQAPLGDMLNDFLYCEMARVLHQAAELEVAMKLHQARMKEVCYSIKAHDHWVLYGDHFPVFDRVCRQCGECISPEFDGGRHMGLCTLRKRLSTTHLYPEEESWV